MGYIKAGSPKSLAGGLGGAVLLAFAARAMTGASAGGAARVALGGCRWCAGGGRGRGGRGGIGVRWCWGLD